MSAAFDPYHLYPDERRELFKLLDRATDRQRAELWAWCRSWCLAKGGKAVPDVKGKGFDRGPREVFWALAVLAIQHGLSLEAAVVRLAAILRRKGG